MPVACTFDQATNRLLIADTHRGRVQVFEKDQDYLDPQFNYKTLRRSTPGYPTAPLSDRGAVLYNEAYRYHGTGYMPVPNIT